MRRTFVIMVLGLAGLAAAPATPGVAGIVGGTPTCTFDEGAGALRVTGASVTVAVDEGGEIRFTNRGSTSPSLPSPTGPIACGEVAPTVTTVDSLQVEAESLDIGDPLVPGKTTTDEAGSPEIEVALRGANGALSVSGTDRDDGISFASDSSGGLIANLNALDEGDQSRDIDLRVERPQGPFGTALAVSTGEGADVVLLDQSGLGPQATYFQGAIDGGSGDDVLVAGGAVVFTRFDAGRDAGSDVLIGGPGGEIMRPGLGDDLVAGGAGTNVLALESAPAARVDLRTSEPQATGQGTKVIDGIASVEGTTGDDVLIGSDAPNVLSGSWGNDRIYGLGGDDELDESFSLHSGNDLLDGGSGDDLVKGDKGSDRLLGGAGDDLVSGGTEPDALSGGRGIDRLRAREKTGLVQEPPNSLPDLLISCGAGDDRRERAEVDAADPRPHGC